LTLRIARRRWFKRLQGNTSGNVRIALIDVTLKDQSGKPRSHARVTKRHG
jgi:hypothetical protein